MNIDPHKEFIVYGHGNTYREECFVPVWNGDHRNKPLGGLWASPVDAAYGWKDFCEGESFRLNDLKESFRFTLNPSARVLVVNSMEDLNSLPDRYFLNKMTLFREGKMGRALSEFDYYDFEAIAKDYDAIYLTEKGVFSSNELYDDEGQAIKRNLCGWDCECLLVMNPGCCLPAEKLWVGEKEKRNRFVYPPRTRYSRTNNFNKENKIQLHR